MGLRSRRAVVGQVAGPDGFADTRPASLAPLIHHAANVMPRPAHRLLGESVLQTGATG